ncbi:MAG: hypothetical protein A2075_17275 [Geobacteraceae bacterium GWC2_58_44]|nr:MAG: hypothetical protein A2075_17275 [Geobacteraceae bacterium GWC2_58_44]HBG06479.1 hypothetical protein [Geobacter sp.]
MKYTVASTLSLGLLLLCSCTIFEAKQPSSPPEAPKTLSVPVGKNWQVVEEAPKLTNERHDRLPFQTEESIQPEGAKTVSPADQRKLETPR